MSDLFSANTLIDVEVSYTVDKNRSGFPIISVLTDDEAAKMKADPSQRDKVRTLFTRWRPQSWKSANDLLVAATVFNHHTQTNDVDWTRFRDSRLKSSLVEWRGVDVTDKDGNTVPCSTENINKLHASVALALLDKFDKATSPDKEEITKN